MRRALAAVLLLAAAASARAEGTTAAFLKIGAGARPVGMGGAFTAVGGDLNAVHFNPAGLATVSGRQFAAMDAKLYEDTRLDFAGVAVPAARGTLALSVLHLSQGAIEARGADRRRLGTFKAADSAASVSYAARLGAFGLGGSVKLLESRIADASAQGWAADLGVRHEGALPGASFGLSVTNLGPGLKFLSERSPLPLAVGAGAAFKGPLGLHLAADVKREVREGRTVVSAGGEYGALPNLALRAGYLAGSADPGAASVSGLGAGLGLRLGGLSVDYAFTPAGELGAAQRLSLTVGF